MSRWKLSIGSAGAIGRRKLKIDALPTTAYVMIGEGCVRNCAFCSQARESTTQSKFLSRVAWDAIPEEEAAAQLGAAFQAGKIKRVCLQVVNRPDSFQAILRALEELRKYGPLPIVVSGYITSVAEAKELFARGAERIGLALDVAEPELFSKIKGGSWQARWELLCACAEAFPGKMTTHLIVGLGEKEVTMWKLIAECYKRKITVGLFAFTPLKGTKMAMVPPPDRGSYRRLQIALELLKQGVSIEQVVCDKQRIIAFNVCNLRQRLADGKAFLTSGCLDCNRPYYNEKPRDVLYNYHRPLSPEEVQQALTESGVVGC
ncbi:MAG TPA: radical SAM protein [Candidatus Avacidaminococcus intestinavium]|uniref:Radical SAM protein n=1 Tax=Candidatus Avacidaminococcus intestinavium TaxID=2840684 RepID=A0A9D1MRR7_9FIRM|nr:radical SAM protein [Candidatus Avacidaminococcus intestinavium]